MVTEDVLKQNNQHTLPYDDLFLRQSDLCFVINEEQKG